MRRHANTSSNCKFVIFGFYGKLLFRKVTLRQIIIIVLKVGFASIADAGVRFTRTVGFFGDYNFGWKIAGPHVAVNGLDWLRIQMGYSVPVTSDKKFKASLQAAAKVFVLSSNFAPYLGFGSGPGSVTIGFMFGGDYNSNNGINFGAGFS